MHFGYLLEMILILFPTLRRIKDQREEGGEKSKQWSGFDVYKKLYWYGCLLEMTLMLLVLILIRDIIDIDVYKKCYWYWLKINIH